MGCKKKELTRNLMLHCISILMGTSFVVGYHFAVLSQPSNYIKSFFNETYVERSGSMSSTLLTSLWSLTVSILLVGCLCGVMPSGFFTKRYGRKKTLMSTNVLQVLGSVLQFVGVVSKVPELLITGRFVCGICAGISSHVGPMYISESSPIKVRGTLGCGYQLLMMFGMFIATVVGTREILGSSSLWKYLLLLPIIPSTISFILLLYLPDSPRYLMFDAKDATSAEKALQFLLREEDAQDFMKDMERELFRQSTTKENRYTLMKLLKERTLRMPFLIVVVMAISLQFSGITVLIFYSVGILENSGVHPDYIQYAVVLQAFINVVATVFGGILVSKVKRKKMYIYPSFVNAIMLGILTVFIHFQVRYPWMNYASTACVVLATGSVTIGPAILIWIVPPELFEQGPRDVALSFFGIVLWCFGTALAFVFEFSLEYIGEFTFTILMATEITLMVFLCIKLPETKDKPFHEIAAFFHAKPAKNKVEPVELTQHRRNDGFFMDVWSKDRHFP